MRLFIVTGPESSGTRLATQILLSAGCFGDAGHEQRLDDPNFQVGPDADVVLRRSYPHRGEALDIKKIQRRFHCWKTVVVVTTRDWDCNALSQVAQGHAPTLADAILKIRYAYCQIFFELSKHCMNYQLLSYEQLILEPKTTQVRLLSSLGLPLPHYATGLVEIRNENRKWMS